MNNEKKDLKTIKNEAENEIGKTQDSKALNGVFKRYLGKEGEISGILRSLENLPREERANIGREANEVKNYLKIKVGEKEKELKEKSGGKAEKIEWIDITVPGKKPASGHLHPLSLVRRECEKIFEGMGFMVATGPELETEWYNFDALNFPPDHPAREMQDTLFIKQENREDLPNRKKLLMRTHTSPVQVRYMEKHNPPLRIIVPGRVFRNEATDVSHDINFHHLEGLMVGKDISVANLKAVIQEFFRRFFDREINIRIRPSYFPFVEPGFEVDMTCLVCGGKGCSTCKGTSWLEMGGAGMVHPNVFKNSGLNPGEWQGFAFGWGLDRLAMMKYKIGDIRLFYGADLRFLEQF